MSLAIYFILGTLLGLSVSLYLYESHKQDLGKKLFTSILTEMKSDLYEEAYLKLYSKALKEVRKAFSLSNQKILEIEKQNNRKLSEKEKDEILNQYFNEIHNS